MSFFTAEPLVTSKNPNIPIDHITRGILPTEGVREAGRSPGAMGGSMLEPDTYSRVGHDSDLERKWIFQYRQCRDVAEIKVQPLRSKYVDRFGVEHDTIWDLLITFTDGRRELVSVKNLVVAKDEGYQADFRLMCRGVPAGFASHARVVCELGLKPALVDRGELYHVALMGEVPPAAEAALGFVKKRRKPVSIQSTCDFLRQLSAPIDPLLHFEALSREFWTVVWLLAQRAIVPVNDDYLTTGSKVQSA